MKDIWIALPRLVLAVCVACWLLYHRADAETRDGQMSMAAVFDDFVAPLIVFLIAAGGSCAQILLREKPARYTIVADALLALAFVGLVWFFWWPRS